MKSSYNNIIMAQLYQSILRNLKYRFSKHIFLLLIIGGMLFGFLACTPDIEDKDPSIRKGAVEKLTDQSKLSDIALNDSDIDVRIAAIKKIKSYEILVKILRDEKNGQVIRKYILEKIDEKNQILFFSVSRDDKDLIIRMAAIKRLEQPDLLGSLAIYADDLVIRRLAVQKLSSHFELQKVLKESKNEEIKEMAKQRIEYLEKQAKINIIDKDPEIRARAVDGITNQTMLSNLATTDENPKVRLAATEKLTDRNILRKIIINDKDLDVRFKAFQKYELLTNETIYSWDDLLEKKQELSWYETGNESTFTPSMLMIINKIEETDPLLNKIAMAEKNDIIKAIIRIKLATQEQKIKSRFPGLRCNATSESIHEDYSIGYSGSGPIMDHRTTGERVTITLVQSGIKIVGYTWSSKFPKRISVNVVEYYIPPEINAVDLLVKLLRKNIFTEDDLAELANSDIEEVSNSAVSAITNKALLSKIETEGKYPSSRSIAENKIKDQEDKK